MEGLLKVLGFVFFIFVGYFLKRTHILKEDTVHALSGLLLYVTLPCLILVCLNGLHIEASYFWLIGLVCKVIHLRSLMVSQSGLT